MPKSKKKARSKKATPAVQKRRTVRDVLKGPTLRQIEESLAAGTKQSLGNFRTMIGW
jgi:hypothetical protein